MEGLKKEHCFPKQLLCPPCRDTGCRDAVLIQKGESVLELSVCNSPFPAAAPGSRDSPAEMMDRPPPGPPPVSFPIQEKAAHLTLMELFK